MDPRLGAFQVVESLHELFPRPAGQHRPVLADIGPRDLPEVDSRSGYLRER